MLKKTILAVALVFLLTVAVAPALAATAAYRFDPTHSAVGFAVKHMTISTVRGHFGEFTGEFHVDEAVCAMSLLAPSLSAADGAGESALNITLKSDSAREQDTRAQLEKMLAQHDLSRWIFTQEILIDEKTPVPHSHPVLTLNTNYTGRDLLLLSVFVHEQLHWFALAHEEDRDRAIAELEGLFPDLPTQPPDGSRGRFSSYQHVIVCYLEFAALKELAGEEQAREVIEFLAGHHYRAIYRLVLDQPDRIRVVLAKHNLIPAAPAPGK